MLQLFDSYQFYEGIFEICKNEIIMRLNLDSKSNENRTDNDHQLQLDLNNSIEITEIKEILYRIFLKELTNQYSDNSGNHIHKYPPGQENNVTAMTLRLLWACTLQGNDCDNCYETFSSELTLKVSHLQHDESQALKLADALVLGTDKSTALRILKKIPLITEKLKFNFFYGYSFK